MRKSDVTDDSAAGSAGFVPFSDEEAALTIGGITIENSEQRVSISGSLDIAADRTGLEQARALMTALETVVAALTTKGDLPTKAEAGETRSVKRARNPFA